MAVIDVFTFNGERDMLKLHLGALYPYVDKFIIVEAKTTFSGHRKPLYFFRDQRHFKPWWDKIIYYVVDENYTLDEIHQAESSPNTQGAAHWKREFLQKESIHKALQEAKVHDNDLVFIGDVDEIWEVDEGGHEITRPLKLKLKVYAYYLNNRSNEQFWGTFVAYYRDIKGQCLNHLRTDPQFRSETEHGWHFTSMGGLQEVQRKLNDSYTPESYNTPDVQQFLPERHAQGVDYLGRPFTFTIDETDWPQYLKENRSKFKHLLR